MLGACPGVEVGPLVVCCGLLSISVVAIDRPRAIALATVLRLGRWAGRLWVEICVVDARGDSVPPGAIDDPLHLQWLLQLALADSPLLVGIEIRGGCLWLLASAEAHRRVPHPGIAPRHAAASALRSVLEPTPREDLELRICTQPTRSGTPQR